MNTKRKKKRINDQNEESTIKPKKKIKVEETKVAIEQDNFENDKNDDSDVSGAENVQEIQVTEKESNKFNGKFLRNSFNSADGFSMLQKFIALCNQNSKKDLAAEYLQAGGSVLEILRLLDQSEKKSIHNASTVFTAINILIMKILAQYPQYQASAEEACRHLINAHLTSIHLMLSSQSKAKHRKIVLKLLAALVSLGGTLPRELLNHLSLHSELLEVLVSHSKPTDPENVRTCFIHFMLAFLIEGNPSDIRALLEKRGVLSIIFAGLIYDYSNVVQLVLTTVKKYILENSSISKTTKLHIFSTPVIQGIVNLYNWKGPKNWPGHKKQKVFTEHIDPEEKEITVNTVHEFLTILLTSNRHGIAFHDRSLGTDFGRKHNQVINTILQSLDKPWEHKKPSDLVVNILTACPDLIKSQWFYTEPYLVPRVSKKWIAVIQFIIKIINNIDVESCLKLYPADKTTVQLSNAVLNLTLPSIIIKNAVIPSLGHTSPIIHYEIINLLLTMIRKIENFITAFETIKLNNSESDTFKSVMLENVLKHMPSFDSVLDVWVKAVIPISVTESSDTDEKDLQFEIKDHLLAILNLLQSYNEVCPEILITTNVESLEKKPIVLLTSLCNLQGMSEEELNTMKVKALKILLYSSISDFSPNEEIFSVALSFLVTKVGDKDPTLDLEVREAINLLLSGCGIFEGSNDEIEIWIDSFSYIETYDDRLEIANWIARIIKRIYKQFDKYVSLVNKFNEITGDECVDVNRLEDIFHELSERSIEDVKLISPMLPVTSISLLLYGAIENLKKSSSNTLAHYMAFILTHVLHCQILTSAFISLIEELKIPVQKYLICWSTNDSLIPIKKSFDSDGVFRTISKILLNPSEDIEINIKETRLYIKHADNTVNYTLNKFEVKALFRMVIFYLTQQLQKNSIESQNMAVYTTILLSLLKIADQMENSTNSLIKDCIKWFLKHPIILQYFKGIYKNNNAVENMITRLLIKISTLFFDLKKLSIISQLMHPYQEKFIMQIKLAIKKCINSDSKKEMKAHIELIDILQLNIRTTVDLLSAIMNLSKEKFLTLDKSNLSLWGEIIPKLIERFSKQARDESRFIITINETLLKKIFYYLIELKTLCQEEMNLWENSLYEYLLKFPSNISTIDKNIFTTLMKIKVIPTTRKILNLLVKRNANFITAFIKYAKNNETILQEKSLILSILSNSTSHKWDQEFLNKLYSSYKTDIVLFLTEPKIDVLCWIEESATAVAYLIKNTFDSKTCQEICQIILSSGDKLDAIQEVHIKLYHVLFKRCTELKADALKDFVQVLIHITVITLKKDSKNVTKLNFLCETLINTINALKAEDNFTFEELTKNYSWSQFTRISLKLGLKVTKEDKSKSSFLLKALVATCDVAYTDNGCEEYVKTIFEMTTSHSEFINIMLSDSNEKSNLVELLWTLVKKNHAVIMATHIPLYLSSYNATLSSSNQFILKIFQHYENNGIKLGDYRPCLWGSAAASHYSVKGETDTALWRQPSTTQVFDLIVPEIVTNTIKYFPVYRNWKGDFVKETKILDQVYDPAFYLPVFFHLLADSNVVACHKVIRSGALSLTIIACSSNCDKIRLAAFTVITRFYYHLEATSSKEKLLWIHFIETLQKGVVKTELPLEKIRLNGFVATFLARTCLIMTQPLNSLYSPLQAFLMAKPALDLNTIPELLQLLHSSEIEHTSHRHWVLEVIRDGFQVDNDMDIAIKCVLFRMLLSFYNCTLSDKLTKNLILQIVKSITNLSKPCIILLNGHGLLPWLYAAVTENFHNGDRDSIVCIVEIVNNIVSVLHESKSKDTYSYLMMVKILLHLKTHFKQNLTVEDFRTFIQVLQKVVINTTVCKALTKDHVNDLVKYSKNLLENVNECEAMLQFGCKYVKRKNLDLDSNTSSQECLYELILTWFNYVQNNN